MLTKEDIKARINLVELISRTVQLKKDGLTRWKGKCPFHADEHASLSVDEEKKLWKCFGCDKGGDCYSWQMLTDSCDFETAKLKFREQCGDMPQPKRMKLDPGLAQGFHDRMPTAKREYYYGRGLTDATIDKFGLGYNGEAFTIPVIDIKGELRNVKYRRDDSLPGADAKAKYWGLTGASVQLFNPHAAENECVFYCEGEFDALMLEQQGYHACTGTGGAGAFQQEWAPLFSKCLTIYVCMDNDEPGQAAAKKIAALLGPRAIILKLPDGVKDVTEYFTVAGHTQPEFADLLLEHDERKERKARLKRGELLNELGLDGFLGSYVDYASELCDSPTEFHIPVGLSILSAAVGNRVCLRLWGMERRLNLWVVLIAPSGFYRKSQAAGLGLELLRRMDLPCLLPTDFSREKLVTAMAARPYGLLPADEFAEMLGKLQRDYMLGTKEMMTSLFELPEYRRETQGETLKIEKPALSILATSTIDWLQERMREGDLRGGFLSRFLFFPAYRKDKFMGLEDNFDQPAQDSLLGNLNRLSNVHGVVDISRCKPMLNKWLEKFEGNVNVGKLPGELVGFFSRSGIMVAKLAALLELSSTSTLTVSEDSAARAITLVEYLNEQMARLLSGELALNRDSRARKKIREVLGRGDGPMAKGDLLRMTNMSKQELEKAIETMLETKEVITETVRPGPGAGRPTQRYQLVVKPE